MSREREHHPEGTGNAGTELALTKARTQPTRLYEQLLAVAVGVVTITGALLTYAAVRIGGEASGADARAASETLTVQSREIYAETQARAFQGLAAQYRTLMAEADAVSSNDPQQAQLLRFTAETFAVQSGILEYLDRRGADANFDYERLRETTLHYNDFTAIPSDQPRLTAQVANNDHARARALTLYIVGLLAVVVLITLARLAPGAHVRHGLSAAAGTGYILLLLSAAWKIWWA